MKSFSHVRLLAIPWTAAYQAPLSTGFSRQGYWSGVPLPSPGKYSKELKTDVQIKTYTWIFISVLLIMTKKWKQDNWLSVNELINKCDISIQWKKYWARKKNEVLKNNEWMNHNTMYGEPYIRAIYKTPYYTILFSWKV